MLAEHWNVLALTRSAGAAMEHVAYQECDLTSDDAFAALPERVSAVVHLAQSRRFREFPAGAADVLAVNVTATERLAHYAVHAGATHFVYASSGGVYAPSTKPLRESDPLLTPERAGWYQGSKLAAESLVHAHRNALVPVVLRPFFIYGVGQRRDMLIPRLCDVIRDRGEIQLAGHDGMFISPTHATDAARSVLRALSLDAPATINVRGPDVLSLRMICDRLGAALGETPRYACGDVPGPAFVADPLLMHELLGAPSHRFDEFFHTVLP